MKTLVSICVLILSVILSACAAPTVTPVPVPPTMTATPDFSEIKDINVDKPAESIKREGEPESFPFYNCDNPVEIKRTLRTTASIQRVTTVSAAVTGSGGIEANIPLAAKAQLEVEVRGSYEQEYQNVLTRADEIELIAPAEKHIVYEIQWERQEFRSIVSFKDKNDIFFSSPYTFTLPVPRGVRSYLVPCPTDTPEPTPVPSVACPQIPPVVQRETPPSRPGYIWIPDEWRWVEDKFELIHGHWERARARPGTYIPGHWDTAQGRCIWIPSHYQ